MKPTFALDLTRDTIGLLHRTPKGWLSVGDVAFDAPDLPEALDYLRKTALGLSPMGVATKIVLPNTQVLYTEVHAPGPSRDEKRKQIAAALEGQTPYDVAELVFDWSGKGATVKVAVVARETLTEAESFAVEHRLNPVSFVAIPEEGNFVGEPWFGPTEAAASLLTEDEKVERDREPVSILHRELPKVEPLATPALDADLLSVAEPAASVAEVRPSEDDEPLPGLEEALNAEGLEGPFADSVADDPSSIEPDAISTDAMEPEDQVDDLHEAIQPLPVEEDLGVDAIGNDVAIPAVQSTPEPDEAPFAHVTDTAAFPEASDDLPAFAGRRKPEAESAEDDLPPAPSSAAMLAFASRRNTPAAPVAQTVDGATRPAVTPGAAKPVTATARPASAKGISGLVTAPSIPGTRGKAKGKTIDIPRPSGLGPTTVKSPARPGGTFGTKAPAKKSSGIVFMVLVALLLLFLALVAFWSTRYLGGDASSTTDEASATDVLPDVTDEMLADMQDPEGMTDPLPEASGAALSETEGDPGADIGSGDLSTDGAPVNIAGDDAAADTSPVEPDVQIEATAPDPLPEPAPDTTIATAVTEVQQPIEDQDEIFLSAMDAPPPALDALALPSLVEARDTLPDPAMPPPAPGTVYQFDAAGLLKPTAEGIVSPDGVMLIAGKPALLPPSRSDVATAAALAAAAIAPPALAPPALAPDSDATSAADASLVTNGDDQAATDDGVETALPPPDPAMAGFRPRPRPETLNPTSDDDAALDPGTGTAVTGLRPLPRPQSIVAAATAVQPVSAEPTDLGAQGASLTAQAEAQLAAAAALEAQNPSIVAISRRPAARPADLSSAVEAAVAAAVREPAPEAEVVEVAAAAVKPEEVDELDEPETASAAPSIPTKANVAKQATYKNAINLSKINLIGTYGTDSRRYALVRQANGKYKKVKVGDKIDGGTVKAITETEVRYQKGGKLLSLKMPKA